MASPSLSVASSSGPPTRWVGVVAIVLTLVGWSSIPLFLRHFADSIDFWPSNGWRYGFSALFWLPVLVWGLARRDLPVGLWRAAFWPSVINCAAQVCFCWAHYKIDPGVLTFGLRSNIVFVTIGAALFFAAERAVIRSPGYLVGVSMVVVGTVGTMLLGEGLPRGATLFGVILAITSGAGFAAYALAVRHWMHGINAIQSFAAISLYTAVGMVALMLALGDRAGLTALDLVGQPVGSGGSRLWIDQFSLLLISALIGIAFGHVAYYFSIARLGLAVSAGVVQLQPFFVSIGSLMLFGERLTIPQWLSGGVAVAGAGLVLAMQHVRRYAEVQRAGEPEAVEFDQLPPDHVAAAVAAETHATGDARASV